MTTTQDAWYDHKVFVLVGPEGDDLYGPYNASGLCGTMHSAVHAGEDFGTLYVLVDGALRKAEVSTRQSAYDEDDYAYVQVFVDGTNIGGYSLDGRS